MNIYYTKNNNTELFSQFNEDCFGKITNMQNYIPLYNRFFNFNDNNYNQINLNNKYYIVKLEKQINNSKFKAIVSDCSNNLFEKTVFIKYSPLLDPAKYMLGRYDLSNIDIFRLPSLKNNDDILEKMTDENNSAYVDGFFSYLSSHLVNNYNFINGIDYYGSFLGIKHNFTVNIEDEIEYLDDSSFFHKNRDVLFNIDSKITSKFFNSTKSNNKQLIIDNNSQDLDIDIEDIISLDISCQDITSQDITSQDITYEDITYEDISCNEEDISNTSYLIYDLSETNLFTDFSQNRRTTNSCDSKSLSSRTSNTEASSDSSLNQTEIDDSDNTSTSSSDSENSDNNDEIMATINKFPVQSIILECCENTLDYYMVNNKIPDKEWESIVLQILLTLITYQKTFNFTHNDLHTNNIVYNTTDKKYLYYKYNNHHYKVPTFGKIYKIIDFGRAIYSVKNQVMCSDSYSKEGDACSQYNFGVYLNSDKKVIEPNMSFDLCRLGCSLFDHFIDDIDDILKLKSPIKKIIVSWVFDDNNKNILYKNDGEERYPDFKLYKMIARIVHNHVPSRVIENQIFEQYFISKKRINNATIINIDSIPSLN